MSFLLCHPPCFWGRVSLTWGWLSEPQGSYRLHFLVAGVTSMCRHIWLWWILRTELRSLCLQGKQFTDRAVCSDMTSRIRSRVSVNIFCAYHMRRSSMFLGPRPRVWLSCLSRDREVGILTKMSKKLNHRKRHGHGVKTVFFFPRDISIQNTCVLSFLGSGGPSMRIVHSWELM